MPYIFLFMLFLFPGVCFSAWYPSADAQQNIVGTACMNDGVYNNGVDLKCSVLAPYNSNPPRWSKRFDDASCNGPRERILEFSCYFVANETCSDGVKNQYEDQVDCGGPNCAACLLEPVTCSDGLLTPGEMGIDCGGPCLQASCVDLCPDDFTLHPLQIVNGDTVPASCEKRIATNYLGLCPKGYNRRESWTVELGSHYICSFSQPTTLVAPESTPQVVDNSPADFTSKVITDSVTESVNSVDNGDGTSTRTTTSTYTDNSITRTETKVEVVNNSNSSVISSTVTGSTTVPGEDNEDTFDLAVPSVGSLPTTEFDTIIEPPEERSIPNMLQEFAESHPLIQVVNTLVVDEQSPQCSILIEDDWNGTPVEINFSLCEWENMLRALGAVFLVLTQAYGIMIILGRDKRGGDS